MKSIFGANWPTTLWGGLFTFALFLALNPNALDNLIPIAWAQTVVRWAVLITNLANKNIAYWFLTLAAISIASWSFIVRWLLNQLESQRMVNADVTNKLITYMEGDHAKMIVVTEKVLLVMDKVLARMDRLDTQVAPNRSANI